MITLLIRCSYRPVGFAKTLASIPFGAHIICSYDDDRALTYIPEGIQKVRVYKHDVLVWYDNYCNPLKELVTSGYFGFLDEGDVLLPGALSELTKHLKGSNGVICQFSRNGKLKPPDNLIRERRILRGKIGMPCLFLHHSHKNAAHFDGSVGAADYHWIKAVAQQVKLKFVALPLVHAESRDNGSIESSAVS